MIDFRQRNFVNSSDTNQNGNNSTNKITNNDIINCNVVAGHNNANTLNNIILNDIKPVYESSSDCLRERYFAYLTIPVR